MKLRPFREVQALQFHNAVFFSAVSDVDTFIDGEAIDLPPLVVDMRTEWRVRYGQKATASGVLP